MERSICVAQRPSVSDVPKGTLYHHLIFKGLGRGSGELCHRLASTDTLRGRGDLDLARTLLQLARGEQARFLHTRQDISELIPHRHHLLFLPPSNACPFASWPQFDGGDGIWTQLRHRVSTFHRWLGEALHGGEETERWEKKEGERGRGRLAHRQRRPKRGRFHTAVECAKAGRG